MPATERALAATDAYRTRLILLRSRAQAVTRYYWAKVGARDFDETGSEWARLTAPVLGELQRVGIRLSAAYLAAFLAAEGRPATPRPVEIPVGVNRAGKPLPEALLASIIAVKVAVGDGHSPVEALARGLHHAVRNAGEDVAHVAREALSAQADDRFVGWRRATYGGCGACLASADGEIHPLDEPMLTHDGCQCVRELVVAGTSEVARRPTGKDQFDAMPAAKQDELLGPEKAQLVRDGAVPFRALIARSPMAAIEDQITERPLAHLI